MPEETVIVTVAYCNNRHHPHDADPFSVHDLYGNKVTFFRRDVPKLIGKLIAALLAPPEFQ